MSKEFEFFSYLLEHYAEYKQQSTASVLKLWDEKNITQEIYNCYHEYHCEALENAFLDIDHLIAHGKHAW